MAKNDKRGLGSPDPQPDIFTVGQTPKAEKGKPGQKKTRTSTPAKVRAQETPREERIKSSVEFLPETIELVDQLKSQFRRKNKRHYPMYQIIADAVQLLADKKLK